MHCSYNLYPPVLSVYLIFLFNSLIPFKSVLFIMPCVYFTFSPDAFHIYVIQINLIIYVYKNNNFKYSVLISLTMMMNMKGFFFFTTESLLHKE